MKSDHGQHETKLQKWVLAGSLELYGFQLDGEGWGVGNVGKQTHVWEESLCLWLEEQTGKSEHQ